MHYRLTENNNKSKIRSLLGSLPALVLTLVILFFLSKAAFNAYMEKRRSEVALGESKAELQKLEERQDFIENELEFLSTPSGREVKLREKFGVGAPGEQVAIIVESTEEGILPPEENTFDKIKSFFESLFER